MIVSRKSILMRIKKPMSLILILSYHLIFTDQPFRINDRQKSISDSLQYRKGMNTIMIVFSHFIQFETEPQLRDGVPDGEQRVVVVSESPDFPLDERLPRVSPVVSVSGRDICYRGRTPFGEGEGPFSSFSWGMEIKGVVTLIWDHEQRRIFYIRQAQYTPELLRFWVFHTFFPLVLELEGVYRILHVASVEIEGRAVLFSAFSFGGKSTLRYYFIRRGHILLSDDTLGVDRREEGCYFAIPSYPFYRPCREVESLGYSAPHFAAQPKSIRALFLLKREAPDASVDIVELKGIEKFKAMHYTPYVGFPFMKVAYFRYLTEMARHIPVYRIHIPWDLERLGEVYDGIMAKVGDSSGAGGFSPVC
jgi:hypothetical protein